VLGAASYVLWRSGVPERFPFALLTQDQLTAERDRYWRGLADRQKNSGSSGRQTLLVGDSHAYDLAYGLMENAYPGKVRLIETFSECFNFGHDPVFAKDKAFCDERLALALSDRDLATADAILLHDHWGGFNADGLADVLAQFRARTAAPIFVFGPKMTYSKNALQIAKDAQGERLASIDSINAYARKFEKPQRRALDETLKAFFSTRALPPGVTYVSVLDVQCPRGEPCNLLSPAGEYLYFDGGHLTLKGSRYFGARLKASHPQLFEPTGP
jgi:hypothetical protein